jgi:hypothetical protein
MTKESKKKIQKATNKKILKSEETSGSLLEMTSFHKGVAAFLVFIVFSSKGILIYNEEILVGLGFTGFVYYVSKFHGKDIGESLDVRGEGFKMKLEENVEKERSLIQNRSKAFGNGSTELDSVEFKAGGDDQKALLSWLYSGWVANQSLSFKSSFGTNFLNITKNESRAGGDEIAVWSNGFRGKIYEAVKESHKAQKGQKSAQEAWILASLSTLEKADL